MLIVGERINSTRSKIQDAIKNRSSAHILKEAKSQLAAGAKYIDINCAVTDKDEPSDIDWTISVIQSAVPGVNICIDSPNYLAIERALKVYKGGGNIMINSITAENDRIRHIMPLALRYNASLVALTMDESGMPNSAEDRGQIAKKILDRARREGFPEEKLYFDALIRPISTEPMQAQEFLRSLSIIKSLGKVNTICGLSNISYGLPNRAVINSSFLSMATYAGLDAAILDPTDKLVATSIAASNAIMCRDGYCANYIKAYREGRLV